jgi:hypothetical protein
VCAVTRAADRESGHAHVGDPDFVHVQPVVTSAVLILFVIVVINTYGALSTYETALSA